MQTSTRTKPALPRGASRGAGPGLPGAAVRERPRQPAANDAGTGKLAETKGSVWRALRAIEVFEAFVARGMADPRRGGDPRLRAAPRSLSRLVWLLGFPDGADPSHPDLVRAIASARAGASELADWLADAGSHEVPPLVVEVAEQDDGWRDPSDRLILFAHEMARATLGELGADLDRLARPAPAHPRK